MSQYDSESEDNPRQVLDTEGDFSLRDSSTTVTFKLRDFKPMVKDRNGRMVPFPGVLAICPVPAAATVQHARAAMGSGANGVWTGTIFTPATDASPTTMFAARAVNSPTPLRTMTRFVLRRRYAPHFGSLKTMVVFVDGACPGNGTAPDPRGGWAFIFQPGAEGVVSGRLEQKGPGGEAHVATSNRAELRAAIAALQFRSWWGEGWERIVLVTDSEYVTNGATTWLRRWAGRDWRTSGNTQVRNRDLWEALSERMGTFAGGGCEVSFWRVQRGWNVDADRAAKTAAETGNAAVDFQGVSGVLV